MTPLRRFAALAVVVLAAAAADAGWWDDAGAARRTTVEEIRKDPDRWRDVTIVVDVRFARLDEPGNPYFTRFGAKEWRAVATFAADATPQAMETKEPFSLFFVRRGTDGDSRLAAVPKGRRVQLRATVRDVVKGEPWIEVLDVVADGDPLTPEEEAVLARGTLLLARDNPAAAESLLRTFAAKRTLPRPVQADVWRKIGAACWSQRRIAEAVEAYSVALAAAPDDIALAEKLSAARALLAASSKAGSADLLATRPASGATDGAAPRVQPRRLLPPGGLPETPPAETPTTDAPKPAPVVEENAERPVPPAPVTETPPAVDPPVETPPPAPPADEPPPPPKPRLLGPR